MEEIVRVMSENPLVATALCFAALLILYFIFKSLIRMALVLIIIAVAIGGYFYFQKPGNRPVNLKEVVEKARTGTGIAVEKGKQAVEEGRELVGKGKEALKNGRELVDKGKVILNRGIDKGMDTGKEIVDKGKGAADGMEKIIGGDRGGDTKLIGEVKK